MRIILGSSSIRRNEIMRRIIRERFPGASLEVVAPNIDEKAFRSDDPYELTAALAARKMKAVRSKVAGPAIIVTSDIVVSCAGVIHEKPVDEEEARSFLVSYRNTLAAGALAAVCAYDTETDSYIAGQESALIWFKDDVLTDEAIEELVSDPAVFNCAGAIAIGHGDFEERFVEKIEGEHECVMGLPRRLTIEHLQRLQKERHA